MLEGIEKNWISYIVSRNAKWYNQSGKVWQFFKKLSIYHMTQQSYPQTFIPEKKLSTQKGVHDFS